MPIGRLRLALTFILCGSLYASGQELHWTPQPWTHHVEWRTAPDPLPAPRPHHWLKALRPSTDTTESVYTVGASIDSGLEDLRTLGHSGLPNTRSYELAAARNFAIATFLLTTGLFRYLRARKAR